MGGYDYLGRLPPPRPGSRKPASFPSNETAFGDTSTAYDLNLEGISPTIDDTSIDTSQMKLPADPSGLPSDWAEDPTHRDPNGKKFVHPDGRKLYWNKGRPGLPGFKGEDHWHSPDHPDGGRKHLLPEMRYRMHQARITSKVMLLRAWVHRVVDICYTEAPECCRHCCRRFGGQFQKTR